MPSLSPRLREAAVYIIQNMQKCAFMGIEKVARAANVSPSTVMRLLLKLGYKNYVEFRDELRQMVMTQLAPIDRLKAVASADTTLSETIGISFNRDISNIETTAGRNRETAWIEACSLCINASQIWVFGGRSSFAVASFLALILEQLTGKASLIAPFDESLPEIVNRIAPDHLGIVVGLPRYLRVTVDVANLVKARGAKLLAITDGPFSPLAKIADASLYAAYEGTGHHNSLVGAMALVNCLAAVLRLQQPEMVNSRLKDLEDIYAKLNLFKTYISHPCP
ncbi:MAG TPA: MurR/RpiR family transcriptional regulator [Firmicutes bacterium]|nr:MurR/RpiR family transcriptional regulator [Bacillota bacterium]